MECLANTGTPVTGVVALLLIICGITMYHWHPNKSNRVSKFVWLPIFALFTISLFGLGTNSAFAESSTCLASAAADTATSIQGSVMRFDVTSNDSAGQGATFVLGSLQLVLPQSPISGSVLSADGLRVTAPGEGTYVANSDGTVIFTPESSFTGTGVGVGYTIKTSLGTVISSTLRPTVTAQVAAKCFSESDLSAGQKVNQLIGVIYQDDGAGGATFIYIGPSSANATLASQTKTSLDPAMFDIDPTIAGIQTSLDHTSDEGWVATYDTGNDTLVVRVTDEAKFFAAYRYEVARQLTVPIAYQQANGCQSISVQLKNLVEHIMTDAP